MNPTSQFSSGNPARWIVVLVTLAFSPAIFGQDVKTTDAYQRIRSVIDQTPAIDTHTHLQPLQMLPTDPVADGRAVTLHSLVRRTYYTWTNPYRPGPRTDPSRRGGNRLHATLPTLSYSMARRAYQEWLDAVPADRIMWGSDCNHPEGTYGATVFTRRCVAEALAEKVVRGELRIEHAEAIGRKIMRENGLKLFPQLKSRLWRDTPPSSASRADASLRLIHRDVAQIQRLVRPGFKAAGGDRSSASMHHDFVHRSGDERR
jgi:hypothetical protein